MEMQKIKKVEVNSKNKSKMKSTILLRHTPKVILGCSICMKVIKHCKILMR